jgi:hypothetical protein
MPQGLRFMGRRHVELQHRELIPGGKGKACVGSLRYQSSMVFMLTDCRDRILSTATTAAVRIGNTGAVGNGLL